MESDSLVFCASDSESVMAVTATSRDEGDEKAEDSSQREGREGTHGRDRTTLRGAESSPTGLRPET